MDSSRNGWTLTDSLARFAASWSEGVRICVKEGGASGRMMEYAYRNQAGGRGKIGRWLDRRFLNYSGWEGVRQRRDSLRQLVTHAINTAQARSGSTVRILDIAGGTADYLIEALANIPAERVSATCVDIAQPALLEGQRRATELGVTSITFHAGNALDGATLAKLAPNPGIVICSGLYELLLDDSIIADSVKTISNMLSAGSVFILSYQINQPLLGRLTASFSRRSGSTPRMKLRTANEIADLLTSNGFLIEQAIVVANLYGIFQAKRVAE